jgi:hypothetical protein
MYNKHYARVAELADALDLGSSGETRAGSTPVSRTSPFVARSYNESLPFFLGCIFTTPMTENMIRDRGE